MFSVPVDDFITPAADDAAMEIARIMTRRGVRGCFHVVGENARVFRARGRRDVVEALQAHEIGFHSNLHSIAPFPVEEMEKLDWEGGVRSFVEAELPGIRDVAEVFGRWPTYYTHVISHAPQTLYGAALLGMRAVGMGTVSEWPVMRYCGNLLVTAEVRAEPPITVPDDDPTLTARMDTAFEKLSALAVGRDPRYPIRAFAHANKFVTWQHFDVVNFLEGRTPPRSEWRLPPLRDKRTTEMLLARLDEFFRQLVATPDVEVVTYADVIRDLGPKSRWVAAADVKAIAAALLSDLDPMTVDGEYLTCAEMFALLCRFLARSSNTIGIRRVIGPREEPFVTTATTESTVEAIMKTCRRVDQDVDDHHAVPAIIEHAGERFGPGSWLRAMAKAVTSGPAGSIIVAPGSEYPALADKDFFNVERVTWAMYPKGFEGKNICRHIHRQSWSAAPVL